MKKHMIAKSMRQAFQLGQTYWQQVDSEFVSHWKRGEFTLEVFNRLIEETVNALDQPASGTEQRVCEDISKRQQLGVSKYGTTVEQNPLKMREWLQHAYEECLDQAVYLKRAIEEMDK